MFIFRQIVKDYPWNWVAGVRWFVEFHDDHKDMAFPLGIAFVSEHIGTRSEFPPVLEFIFVVDQYRRRGIAKRLVKACQRRWSNLMLTPAISEEGEHLLRSLHRSAKPKRRPSKKKPAAKGSA